MFRRNVGFYPLAHGALRAVSALRESTIRRNRCISCPLLRGGHCPRIAPPHSPPMPTRNPIPPLARTGQHQHFQLLVLDRKGPHNQQEIGKKPEIAVLVPTAAMPVSRPQLRVGNNSPEFSGGACPFRRLLAYDRHGGQCFTSVQSHQGAPAERKRHPQRDRQRRRGIAANADGRHPLSLLLVSG